MLRVSRFVRPQIVLLMVPFGVGISVGAGSLFFKWAPTVIFNFLCLVLGISLVRFSAFFVRVAPLIITLNILWLSHAYLLPAGLAHIFDFFATPFRLYSHLFWISALPTACFFFMCGRIWRNSIAESSSKSSGPLSLAIVAVLLAAIAPRAYIDLPELPFNSSSWFASPPLDPSCLLPAASLLGAIAPRYVGPAYVGPAAVFAIARIPFVSTILRIPMSVAYEPFEWLGIRPSQYPIDLGLIFGAIGLALIATRLRGQYGSFYKRSRWSQSS
jgi:hypothetical protein